MGRSGSRRARQASAPRSRLAWARRTKGAHDLTRVQAPFEVGRHLQRLTDRRQFSPRPADAHFPLCRMCLTQGRTGDANHPFEGNSAADSARPSVPLRTSGTSPWRFSRIASAMRSTTAAVQHVQRLGAALASGPGSRAAAPGSRWCSRSMRSPGSAPGSGTRSPRRTSSTTRSTCRPPVGRRRGTADRARRRAPPCWRAGARARPTTPRGA